MRPLAYFLPLACLCGAAAVAAPPLVFQDVTKQVGLLPDVGGIAGHAAAWGDVDGDGRPDLYVGSFHEGGAKTNMFFRQAEGNFVRDDQKLLEVAGRASGAVLADLDNDGDLDLYLSNLGGGRGDAATGNRLFRNDGQGNFADVSAHSGACPDQFRGRSVAVLDFDGDGRLDLLLGESVSYGSAKRSRLMRNLGGLKFADVSDEAGLPPGVPGLGVAAGDVNNDRWPDIFLAGSEGGNRLYLNDGHGRFREAPGGEQVFVWTYTTPDDTTAGVALGDVNRDGLLDIVIGQHYKRPWREPVPVRLYLNRGIHSGVPRFEEVTESAGLPALPMKGPHVEIQDFDNDGWPDIYVSIVKFAGGRPCPVIFHNSGVEAGLPRFRDTALAVNDFPTDEDRAISRTGQFFDKMLKEHKIIYMAPGPTADYDRDGRLDLFLANWWTSDPSLLLRNETDGGHWLDVVVEASGGVNRQGIGSRVKIYQAGKLGQADALLGCQDISVGYGYCSGQEAVAHFGLGESAFCEVEVLLPHGKGRIVRSKVAADQRLTVKHEP